jgi:hypothetical protein
MTADISGSADYYNIHLFPPYSFTYFTINSIFGLYYFLEEKYEENAFMDYGYHHARGISSACRRLQKKGSRSGKSGTDHGLMARR